MRKLSLLVLAFAAGCAAPSASDTIGSGAPQPQLAAAGLDASQVSALEALKTRSGRAFDLSSLGRHAIHLVAARTGAPELANGANAADVTLAFLADNKDLFTMRAPTSELRMTKHQVDRLAMTHVRFEQIVRGVRVVGAELMAHYDAAGRITSIDSTYVPGLDALDVAPSIDAAAAEAVAISAVTESSAHAEKTELVVFAGVAESPQPAALAFRTTVRALGGKTPAIWVTTVDAKTGEILDRYDNLQTMGGTGVGVLGDTKQLQVAETTSSGTYALYDTSRGALIQTFTSGDQQVTATEGASLLTSSSTTSWDRVNPGPGAAVDAHFNAGVVYDYYKKTHNRNGIDDQGSPMLSAAHFGQQYDNAFWDGESMNYGDGATLFKPLSAAVDVCGHEFTHGVTQNTSNLAYQGQAGALNEAVSDIFGAFIEHSVAPSETANWQIGELIGLSGPIRDFKNPSIGQQPDNMSHYVNTSQDSGGVHINSGIVNNAAFLMTAGGKNPTSQQGPTYGLGWSKSEQLWYRVNSNYLTTNANFGAAAQATMQAAKDLAFTANEMNIVDCAWKATGVTTGSCAAITDPTTAPQSAPGGGDVGGPTAGSSAGKGSDAPAADGDDDTGASGGTGDTGDTGDGTTTPAKKKHTSLGASASTGCSTSGAGSSSSGAPFALMVALALVAKAGRRKRG